MNENYIEEMENEEEALNQSLALNKVIINLLNNREKLIRECLLLSLLAYL